jgi:hypothetical protein
MIVMALGLPGETGINEALCSGSAMAAPGMRVGMYYGA